MSFRTFKLPILFFNEKSCTKLDIYRFIIHGIYESYKRSDDYVSSSKSAIGNGAQEFLAHTMFYGDDPMLAYEQCLQNGYLKRQNYSGVKNQDLTKNISRILSICCASPDKLPIALYSSFKSSNKVFQLTPTPLYYKIKEFINSLDGDDFTISNEIVFVANK